MQHVIPVDQLGSNGASMAEAVEKCVHCGFCLATCPTYKVLGQEMDSPRGRIVIMKTVLEDGAELEESLPYIDQCLGCMACVTACPSGVQYGELITPFRFYAQERRERSWSDAAARKVALATLPYPSRFRLAAVAGRAAGPARGVMPKPFQAMLDLLPESLPSSRTMPEVYPAQGKRRARVALLAGCVQQVIEPEVNWATLRVLARNGVEVVIPAKQGCCGALSMHSGDEAGAQRLAGRNLDLFLTDVDAIISNAAGCGSGMKEYPLLFKGHELESQAIAFSGKVMDISEFLVQLGPLSPPPLPTPLKLAYHDACHLSHAQGITAQPRQLLSAVPNLQLVPIAEGELCCGSAGIYNIEQPETAQELGFRKAGHILESGAGGVVMGNIGCMVQVRKSLAAMDRPIPVWHTIEVLDRAYRNGN
ncbi:MAG TPA: heterodisulfide reductase-related iron-sulfur binding cluster [Anaerolineales bacterium]